MFVISIDQIIWLFWSEFLIISSPYRLMPSLGTRPVLVNVTRIIVQQEVSIRVLAPPFWPSFSAPMVKRNWPSKNSSHSNRDYRMKSYALRLVDSILVMENNVYYMELNFSTESYAHGRGRTFLGDEVLLILNLKCCISEILTLILY